MTAQDPAPAAPARVTPAAGPSRPPRRVQLGRRTLAWAILTAALTGALLVFLRPSDPLSGVATVAVAVLGAATLARYVPMVGTRPELGCTPCAVVSGLSVPIAIGVLAAGMAPLATAIAAFGLVQRLRQPDTCPT
ncbi:MAG: hypothetical protein KQH57_14225 [Actinomycetales bacterium]|nr:hypothetical protein [Actinomycetales bacterium]